MVFLLANLCTQAEPTSHTSVVPLEPAASQVPTSKSSGTLRWEAADGTVPPELIETISICLHTHASWKMPFSELADGGGAILLLVLCSIPAAAYRLSYVMPYDRFKVAVLDSLERCLQFLDELPYLPDCMVVEEDGLAGGLEAITKVKALGTGTGPALVKLHGMPDRVTLGVLRRPHDEQRSESAEAEVAQRQSPSRRPRLQQPQYCIPNKYLHVNMFIFRHQVESICGQ